MANRTDNKLPPYTEAQSKAWLSWLARGMQQHGQTVFLIEQLQPSWLPTRGLRCAYILCSRLFVGLYIGGMFVLLSFTPLRVTPILAFGPITALIGVALYFGIADLVRLELSSRQTQADGELVPVYVAFDAILIGVFTVACSDVLQISDAHALFIGVFCGLVFRLTSINESLDADIQTTEVLSWSWRQARTRAIENFVHGVIFGVGGVVLVGIMLLIAWLLDPSITKDALATADWERVAFDTARTLLVVGLLFSFPFCLFSGLSRSVRDMKTTPGEGLFLSVRNALIGGAIIAVSCAMFFTLILSGIEVLISGQVGLAPIRFGLQLGILFGLGASLWYGLGDVIRHVILIHLLAWSGCSPPNYFHFLDYAANDLTFLQKVGGGYIFMHRMLLEHFAAMEGEDTPNSKSTSVLAAPTSLDPAPDR